MYNFNEQNRFLSKGLIIATTSLIVFVLKTYFGIEIPKVDTLIDLTLIVLVEFGIINNPRDKSHI